ncbi:quinon protein alcohol dehydrogenase-like superfamily [Exophiala viscosa]|uniref:Quinon protein alcohol dehydrogenase-like superfamily n=1 Tax=Exophiala viscosa TaxID=2486360 RepID=A0AAN6IC09_9EURO|nr:quinon protein alcohol dehydrogenase-like superfamily [Exophiala viscosa]
MATKVNFKTTFEAARTIEPIYTGGGISHNANGTLIATSVEEDVLVVEVKTGKILCRIEGDGEAVTSLSLAPDASSLVICSRSLSLRIYSINTEEDSATLTSNLLRTLKPHSTPVVCSAIDSTGSLLATGGADGTVKVWDVRGGYVSHTFHGHGGVVSALKFFSTKSGNASSQVAANSSRKRKIRNAEQTEVEETSAGPSICLASGGEDGKIRVWNLASRNSIATLDSHVSVVRSLEFSEQQQLLLSANRDRTLILWDTQSWKQQKVIPAMEVLETAGFIGDSQYCYAGGEHGVVRIWDALQGREVTTKQKSGLENDAITAIVHITEGNTLLSIHQDQTMRERSLSGLWDLADNKSIELPLLRTISGNYDEVIDMACVGPGRTLLALATNTESIRLISINDDSKDGSKSSETTSFGNDVALLEGHEEIIICLDVDWSGYWLATGAKDNTARLWRLDPASSTYKCFAVFAGHAESLGAIALPRSPPNDGLAAKKPADYAPAFLLTGSQDKTVKRWETARLKYSKSMAEPHSGVKALFTRVAHEKDINAIDVSPIAPLFASASQDRTIKIWSLEDGSVAGILRGHKRGVWSIRFSPAGTPPLALPDGGSSGSRGLLVSGSGDRTVKVWSLATYTCLQTFEGHSNSVLKVIWIPPSNPPSESDTETESRQSQTNQPLIASASSDTLVKLWSAYSGTDSDHLLATLDNHTDRVWALAAPNSYSQTPSKSHAAYPYPLISGAADATLTFWRDTTVQTATLASKRATERIEQDQQLQNHIFAKNYREAITLSLALNHPGRLLRVFEDVVNLPDAEKETSSVMGVRAVDQVLASLDHQQIFTLLERVRDWNTNARTATVAQTVLNCLFRSYPASMFVDMAKERKLGASGKGMKELLRALEVYTERHYKRMEELVDESYLIEYTLREMDEISGISAGFDGILANGHDNGDEEDFVML